jgi:hypothetical protein
MEILNYLPPVSEDALKLFQTIVETSLPKDYLAHLRKYNGGYPVPAAFNFSDGSPGSTVEEFFRINSHETHNDFVRNLKLYSERLPDEFLPIAYDAFGNIVCLGLRQHRGEVYFWDHEFEADDGEQPTMRNMVKIADSFEAFLNGLTEL